MKYFVTIGARTLEVELGPEGVRVDGKELTLQPRRIALVEL